MLTETAAAAGALCDPLTSASCIVKTLGGAAAGFTVGNVPGAVAGAVAANGGAGSAVHAVTGAVAGAAVSGLAGAIQNGIATIVTSTITWWISIPSPDLTTDPVPQMIQQWMLPFTAAVAVTGFITAGIRMALSRKAAPLAEVGSGLLTMAITSAVGTVLPTLLLRAGDSFSTYVLNAATGGQFAARMTALLTLGANPLGAPGLIIVLGIFAIIMTAIQAILLLFRMGSVIILAGLLPLAAAGQMTPLTRPWLKKVAGWMLSLIFYKPAAALVYATGFALLGSGNSAQDALMGFAVLLLSLIALPALMRFFNWTTGALEPSAGSGMLGAVLGGASAVGAMRSYGASAAGQASAVSGSLGAPGGGTGPGGSPPGGGHGPGIPGGPQGGGQGPGGPGPGARPGGPGGGSTSGVTAPAGGATGTQAPGAVSGASSAGTAASSGVAAGAAATGVGAVGAGVITLGTQAAAAGRNFADGAMNAPEQRS